MTGVDTPQNYPTIMNTLHDLTIFYSKLTRMICSCVNGGLHEESGV
uniref:Uncharacterized protein n=1 Tax=Solanum lycopersicum TaxID=4081 RepID=A0A3Q7FQ05_SOLLC